MVLILAAAAQLLVVLDSAVMNVALPSIARDLGLDGPVLTWVVNAYAVSFAGFLLVSGRLVDVFGGRRVLLAGLAGFSSASLVGGLAPAGWLLVGARAVQGLAAAALAAASLAVLLGAFPVGGARHRALTVWGAAAAAGGALGTLLGGLLTAALTWRSTLLVNLPVGLGLGFLGLRALPAVVVGGSGSGGLAALPRVVARLLRVRTVAVGNALMALVGGASTAMWFFLSLHLQNVSGYGPLRAGLAVTPFALLIVLLSRVVPALIRRIGRRRLVVCSALLATAGFAWWAARLGVHASYLADVLPPGLLAAAGCSGLVAAPVVAIATDAAPAGLSGTVSGLANTTRMLGGALALAGLAALASAHAGSPEALSAGYNLAFAATAGLTLLMAPLAAVGLRPARPGSPG